MYQHIRDIREDHDLSQQQMAELLNIGQTPIPIMNWEKSTFR